MFSTSVNLSQESGIFSIEKIFMCADVDTHNEICNKKDLKKTGNQPSYREHTVSVVRIRENETEA